MYLGEWPRRDDYFVGDSEYGLFSTGVILAALGAGVKIASIFPGNLKATPPQPAEQAAIVVVNEHYKSIAAICDGPTITA
jgi:ornithine cyclodeaminase